MPSEIAFAPDDWVLLNELPFKVILAAAVVDVNGPLGAASKEMVFGARKLVREATASYAGNRIIAQVLEVAAEDNGQSDEISLDDELARQAAIVEALALCERAAFLLGDHDVADESTQYRQWVYDAARATAAATKSGGFLGFGADDISESEEEFLSQLRNALGLNSSHD